MTKGETLVIVFACAVGFLWVLRRLGESWGIGRARQPGQPAPQAGCSLGGCGGKMLLASALVALVLWYLYSRLTYADWIRLWWNYG